MGKWNNFFLQRMGVAANNAPYPVCESVATWGMFCKEIPFKLIEKVKEPAKRSWNDEHGDDEYIPSGGLKLEAYTMKVEFACKKMPAENPFGSDAVSDVRTNVAAFLEYLRTSGLMKMYSSYTRIGRQNVRFVGVDDDADWVSEEDGTEFLVFSVNLKVNDPITDIVLSSSSS